MGRNESAQGVFSGGYSSMIKVWVKRGSFVIGLCRSPLECNKVWARRCFANQKIASGKNSSRKRQGSSLFGQ